MDPTYLWYEWGSKADDTYVMRGSTANRSTLSTLAIGHKAGDPSGRSRRSYLHFDVGSGYLVMNASLKLYTTFDPECTATVIDVHRVTADWTGSTMTGWPGAAYASTPEVSRAPYNNGSPQCTTGWYGWHSEQLKKTVKAWVEGDPLVPNYGLMVKAQNESDGATASYREFHSQEGGAATSQDPYLEVFFNGDPHEPIELTPGPGSRLTTTTPVLEGKYFDLDGDGGRVDFEVYPSSSTATSARLAAGSGASCSASCYSPWRVPSTAGLTAGSAYQWRARSVDTYGATSDWTAFQSFKINRPPRLPASLSPATGSRVTFTPTLSGTFVDDDGDAGRLHFTVYNSSGAVVTSGTGGVVSSSTRSSWTVPAGALAGSTTYTWRAQADDGLQVSGATDGTSFTVNQPPSAPIDLVPRTGATVPSLTPALYGRVLDPDNTVRGRWTVMRADGTVIATSASDLAASGTFVSYFVPPGLLQAEADYSWHMSACDADGACSGTTSTHTFRTAGKPTAPEDVSATGGDESAGVSWTPSSNRGSPVINYTVTSKPEGRQATVTGDQRKATIPGLRNGVHYTFTVEATNSIGRSGESMPSNATVVQPGPTGSLVGGTVEPATPAFPLLLAGNGVLNSSWHQGATSDVPGVEVQGYVVRTYTAAGVLIDSARECFYCTTHTVRGVSNGTAYYFTVASLFTPLYRDELPTPRESVAVRSSLAVPSPPYSFHDDDPRHNRYDISDEASIAANSITADSADYAGTAIDWNSRRVRTMYVDGPTFSDRRAVLTAYGATPSPELLTVWPVKYSLARLRHIQASIVRDTNYWAQQYGIEISGVSERLSINKVVVHAVPATEQTLQRLSAQYRLVGDELVLGGARVETRLQGEPAVQPSPFPGGLLVVNAESNASCTGGFTFKREDEGGATYFHSTAAHCSSRPRNQDTGEPGDVFNNGDPDPAKRLVVGEVLLRGNPDGRTDVAILGPLKEGEVQKKVRVQEPARLDPVEGYAERISEGDRVCKTGAKTGYTCGEITSTYSSRGNGSIGQIVVQAQGNEYPNFSAPGDSGAPVTVQLLRKKNEKQQRAVGMLSTGGTERSEDGEIRYFTAANINEIHREFNVRVHEVNNFGPD